MTTRLKVALAGGALVVLSTTGGFLVARSAAARRVEAEVREDVRRAQQAADRTQRLHALELVALARRLAGDAEFESLFAPANSVQDRARAAFVAIEGHNARLEKAGGKADLILVLDAEGKVIARDLDPRALWGEDMRARFPAVGVALSGRAGTDAWLFDGKMMRVATAPIGSAQRPLGAIAVGYVVNARQARLERELLGAEVAYFLDGRIHASSLQVPGSVGETGDGAEDVEMVSAASKTLFSADGVVQQALAAGRSGQMLVTAELEGRFPHRYLASAGLLSSDSPTQAGYVVMASLTEPLGAAYRQARVILLVGLVALLVLVSSIVWLGRHFERSLDRVEVGVSEVISGNLDHSFEAFDEFEGLCNGLNVMLARLLGRPEPGAGADEDVDVPSPAEEPAGNEPQAPAPTDS